MARTDLSVYILDRLKDSTNVLAVLGAMTSTNFRLYGFFPQQQPVLSGHEPAEGWLVFTPDRPTQIDAEAILERVGVEFQIFTTRRTLADDIIDSLDALWNWRIWQQKDVGIGDYWLLFSKREETQSDYTTASDLASSRTDVHLYRRTIRFRWTLVKKEAEA